MEKQEAAASSLNIFCSYVDADEPLHNELKQRLSSLRQKGIIASWYDRQIVPAQCASRQAQVLGSLTIVGSCRHSQDQLVQRSQLIAEGFPMGELLQQRVLLARQLEGWRLRT